MSSIQIYYLIQPKHITSLRKMNISDLDTILRQGDITYQDLKTQIQSDPSFCRDEKSIRYINFLSLISSDIILYASFGGKLVGALAFMFNITPSGNKIINFNGICSPKKYSGLGVGQELINTLIWIGKSSDVKYIKLECKGEDIKNYYKNKFGFQVERKVEKSYDSDEDSDDEDSEPYYYMKLNLSDILGGNKRKRYNLKSVRKNIIKRKNKTTKKRNSNKKRWI